MSRGIVLSLAQFDFSYNSPILCIFFLQLQIFFRHILLFFIKKFVFLSFLCLFLMKYPQQDINQSETGIGDMKLSMKL